MRWNLMVEKDVCNKHRTKQELDWYIFYHVLQEEKFFISNSDSVSEFDSDFDNFVIFMVYSHIYIA